MAKSRSILLPVSAALVGLTLLCRVAFVVPRTSSSHLQPRSQATALRASANSVPTGLTWPSPEAEAKLREVDGIKLYPTHAWTDDMV
eukprot:CAMPEP_0185903902 /NCGR_PEP_ID=MMETSP0196C-20130402/3210_1 /TAXON_ID=2932 /ORGANISM="Alexandrium fundyense, Strain CCMP1719" /LENGTH=86 /DNA_ID=CAMNT_0028623067 /DNA_START=32 /DNA_END=288 /DNA_ORIENTATION=+